MRFVLDLERLSLKDTGDGHLYRVSAGDGRILEVLLAAKGRPVTTFTLAERMGYMEGQYTKEQAHHMVQVAVHRLRDRLPFIPLQTVGGRALGWAGEYSGYYLSDTEWECPSCGRTT